MVIAFEMTGSTSPSFLPLVTFLIAKLRADVDYIFPIVLAVLVSKWVANIFGRNGMYVFRYSGSWIAFLRGLRQCNAVTTNM